MSENQIIIHYQENEIFHIINPLIVPKVGEVIRLSITNLDEEHWDVESIDGDFKVVDVEQHYCINYKKKNPNKAGETDQWMNIYIDVEKV
tara:strand:+ start:493 stop:762 length:270 start_codon:yes stop_codon:yes gene_type:complete